jgi:hypothetical protein
MEDTELPHPADDPTLEPIRAAIRKLPPYPFHCKDDTMQTDYVKGLQACVTPKALREFVARWAPLWTINFREPDVTSVEEQSLAEGTFDEGEVFAAMATLRQEASTDEARNELDRLMQDSLPHRTAMNALMPRAMIEMTIVANHFGAPVNVAWIQASGLVELF